MDNCIFGELAQLFLPFEILFVKITPPFKCLWRQLIRFFGTEWLFFLYENRTFWEKKIIDFMDVLWPDSTCVKVLKLWRHFSPLLFLVSSFMSFCCAVAFCTLELFPETSFTDSLLMTEPSSLGNLLQVTIATRSSGESVHVWNERMVMSFSLSASSSQKHTVHINARTHNQTSKTHLLVPNQCGA